MSDTIVNKFTNTIKNIIAPTSGENTKGGIVEWSRYSKITFIVIIVFLFVAILSCFINFLSYLHRARIKFCNLVIPPHDYTRSLCLLSKIQSRKYTI